jgi:GTP cyclohydrolase I
MKIYLAGVYSRPYLIEKFKPEMILESFFYAKGVIVTAKAQHLCMTARGVEKQKSEMITSAVRGVFKENQGARQEFLSLVSQLDS